MKTTRMLKILVMALGLMVCSAPIVHGAQYLTVKGQYVTSITLELGQSRTVEIVSTDGASYVDYVGFDNGAVLGDFSHLETKPEAGNLAAVVEYDQPAFYGYYVNATGISPAPSPGIHFVFEYLAQQVGETDLKLYDSTFTTVIDSIHITVIPLQSLPMATAFTYQGRLMDSNSPANGLYDFEFKLYDNTDPVFAAQQGNTIDINDLDVIDGRFTLELDFGSDVFNGDARWLEIAVRPGDSNDPNAFVSLSPRQELTPAPYALQTRGIFVDDSGNVCIGGTDPWYALDVYKAVSDSWVAGFHNLGTGDTDGGVIVRAFGGDPLLVQSATETVLNVKQNGNVGIGTVLPDKKLTVADGDFAVYPGQSSEPSIITDGFNVKLGDPDGIGNQVFLEIDENNEKFVFNNGNVGIGTAAPVAMLDVRGNIQVDQKIQAHDAGGLELATDEGTTRIFVGDDGKVGVGTTTPRASLEVTNTGNSHAILASTTYIPVYAHRISTTGTWPAVAGDCNSEASGASGVRGGILSTNPGALGAGVYGYNNGTGSNGIGVRGHHAGNGYAGYFTGGKNYFEGNIGIGTKTPSEKLDVNGNIDVSNNRVKSYRGFPRPDYDSGWVSVSPGGGVEFTHGLGGSVDNYVVDLQFKDDTGHVHNVGLGQYFDGVDYRGGTYHYLDTDKVTIYRQSQDTECFKHRIRIWVYD